MENMNETTQKQSQKNAGCPCMSMNKKYAEGFDYKDIKKPAKSSASATDGISNSEDELDILEIEEDEFE